MSNEDKIISMLESMQKGMNSMQDDIKSMKTDIISMQNDIKSMKTDINSMQDDIKSMNTEINSMQNDIKSMKNDIVSLKEDNNLIKIQLKEHGQILSALKTASEFQKAETDGIKIEIARLSGEVKALADKIDFINEDIKDMKETDKSLLEMYGEHEAQFRTLRRRII